LTADEVVPDGAYGLCNPIALRRRRTKNVGFLGKARRLAHITCVMHLRQRQSPRIACSEVVQRSEQREQKDCRTKYKHGAECVEHERREHKYNEGDPCSETLGCLKRGRGCLPRLVGHEFLKMSLLITRLRRPRRVRKGAEQR
jgi:hypothetical protein